MTYLRNVLTLALLVGFGLSASQAQQVRTLRLEGDAFMLGELGLVLAEEDETVKVQAKMPSETSNKAKGPALSEGDTILYFNGKRVRSVAKLRSLYDALAVNDEIKLGVRRGQETLIISFPKAKEGSGDVADVMQRRNGNGRRIVRTFEGGEAPDLKPLPALGAVVTASGQQVRVDVVFSEEHPAKLKEGDLITKINGNAVQSPATLEKTLAAIKTGETINLAYKRKGKTHTITFAKPDPASMPRVMISTDRN